MTTYRQGDVILLPFPFTDLSASKQRPALVISSNWYNENRTDVILLAITSQIPSEFAKDEFLLSNADQKMINLPRTSLIKIGKIITIDQRLIRKTLGHLPETTLTQIKSLLNNIFDL